MWRRWGGGGCLLDGMVKGGKEIPTSKCDIYGRGGALMWRSKGHRCEVGGESHVKWVGNPM